MKKGDKNKEGDDKKNKWRRCGGVLCVTSSAAYFENKALIKFTAKALSPP